MLDSLFRRQKNNTSPRQSRVSGQTRGRSTPDKRSAATVSTKSTFFSYHSSTQASEPRPQTRQAQHESNQSRTIKLHNIPFIFAVVSLIGCVLYSTTLSSDIRLQPVNKNSKLLRELAEYQKEANRILGSSIWNQNKLTIDTAKFEKNMQATFPELSRAAMTLPLVGRRPVIELVDEKPVLFLASGQGVFIIDKNGTAIARVNDLKGAADLSLPTLRDEANLKIEVGKGALTSQDVTFITTVITELQAKKLSINSVILPPLASEMHVKIDGQNYFIKFGLLTDPRVAVGQYLAALARFERDGVAPKEYVDSRVEEKIYFR